MVLQSQHGIVQNVLNNPFAWAGVLLGVGVPIVVAVYLGFGASANKRENMRTYLSFGLAIAAFLAFTSLLRTGDIEPQTYTSLVAAALGGAGGYKVHERGHDKGREMARELVAGGVSAGGTGDSRPQEPEGTDGDDDGSGPNGEGS